VLPPLAVASRGVATIRIGSATTTIATW